MSLDLPSLRGRRALITGAGGFIGSRLAERLVLEHGVEVRAIVRGFAGAEAGTALSGFPAAGGGLSFVM